MTGAAQEYIAAAHYMLYGSDADRVILGLHGLGGDSSQPLGHLPTGLDNFGVLAPDLRAHGATPIVGKPSDFTLDSLADDVVALVDDLRLNKKSFVLVGVSMGAAIALHLRERLPVTGLVLIRPAFTATPRPHNLEVFVRIGELLEAHEPAEAERRFVDTAEYRDVLAVSERGAASLRSQFTDTNARVRSVRLREIPRNTAYRDTAELARVDVPTLVIGTDRDPNHPYAVAEEWAAGIPKARLLPVVARDVDADRQMQDIHAGISSFLDQHA